MGFLDVIRVLLAVINIIANILGFIFSLIIVVIGVIGLVLFNLYFTNFNEDILYYNVGFSLYVAVGVIACIFTIAAIIGSYLAYCPVNPVMKGIAILFLSVHLIAFVIVFLLALAGVIVAFVFRDNVSSNFVSVLDRIVNESYSLDFNSTQILVTTIQTTIGCCGINGPADFARYPGYTDLYLPLGCCNTTLTSCTPQLASGSTGCGALIGEVLVTYYNAIGGFGVFELIVIFLLLIVELVLIILVVTKDNDGGGHMKVV